MIINNIELTNFKSHKSTKIEFKKGISLILGENGAGKSSILEAISYAFFKQVNGKLEENIRKPQNRKDIVDKMEVCVQFQHNGRLYKIARGRNKSKSVAKLELLDKNGIHLLSKGDRNVTNDIESILEMDSKSFLNAIYIRQGEITNLIEKTAAERKELITKLLNIDSLEVAWDEIKNIINIYETQKNVNEGKLANINEIREKNTELLQNISEKERQIKEYETEINTKKSQLIIIEEDIKKEDIIKNKHEKLTNDYQFKKEESNHLEDLENKYTYELNEINKNKEKIRILEKEISPLNKLREIKDLKTKINSYKKDSLNKENIIREINENKGIIIYNKENYEKYIQLKKEKEDISKELEKLTEKKLKEMEVESEIKHLTDQVNILYYKINQISEKARKLFKKNINNPIDIQKITIREKTKTEELIKILEKKILKKKKEISVCETELNSTKKSLEDLEKTEDICPICQSEISHDKHAELSDKYKNTIVTYELRIEELSKANNNQEIELQELKEYEQNINDINIQKLKEEHAEYTQLCDTIHEKKKLKPIIEETKAKIEEIKNKENDCNQSIESLEEDYNKYNFAKIRLNQLPQVDEANKEKEIIDNKISENTLKIKKISQTVRIGDDIERKIKYLEKKQNDYNQLIGTVLNEEKIIQEKEETTTKIHKVKLELSNIKSQINELSFDYEKYERINNKYTLCQENIESISRNYIVKKTELKKDKQQQEKYVEEIKNLKEIEKQQVHIGDYIQLLNEIRSTYSKDGVQKDLRNIVRPEIEKNTMDIFSEFGFDYSAINLDEDYNLIVQTRQEQIDLNMLSGGEKIVIALALRLGIAKAISKNKMELLVLDEPTIHLDSERRTELIDIIRKINVVPQMIVVSHDEEMEALSTNIIKISKNNGISTCNS